MEVSWAGAAPARQRPLRLYPWRFGRITHMPYKYWRDKRAYDRHFHRDNIISRHRDRAHLANRRYGSPRLTAAGVTAVFAKRASCYYCGAPVDGRSGALEHLVARVALPVVTGAVVYTTPDSCLAVCLSIRSVADPWKLCGLFSKSGHGLCVFVGQ